MKKVSNVLIKTASVGSIACTMAMPLVSIAKETIKELPEVTVEGSKENSKYVANEKSSLPMMGRSALETPQSIISVSKKLIQDQGTISTSNALRNVSGLTLAAGEGGNQGDNIFIRGFAARGDIYLDGIRDFGNYTRDPFNIEKIDVLKGTSGAVAGRGSIGGVVSQESKQAKLKKITDASFTVGTDATRRATVDINRKIEGLEGAAFRLNMMTHDADVAGRDVVNNKRTGFAPTLAFGIGTETRSSISYLYQAENNIPDYGIPIVGTRPADVDRENYYGFSNGVNYLKTTANILTGKIEHDFSDKTKIEQILRFAKYERDALISAPRVSGSSPAPVNRSQQVISSNDNMLNARTTLTHNFNTGSIKHEFTSGFEFIRETSTPRRLAYSGVPTADFYNPNANDIFSGTGSLRDNLDIAVNTQAIFIGDNIAINKKLDVILGARIDRYNIDYTGRTPTTNSSIDRTDYMPSLRGGVVYKPASNSSVYLNYATSYTPVTDFGFVNPQAIQNVDPEENSTLELGTKWGFLNNKLQTAFAIFDTTKRNARVFNPDNVTETILAGKQRSRGFEASLSGEITERLDIFTNYTFMNVKIVNSTSAPSSPREGTTMPNAPKHTFNLWGTYKVLPKFQVGLGATAISSRVTRLTTNSNTIGESAASGYVTFNAMAKYTVNPKMNFQFNVYNLANKNYIDTVYPGHVVPGAGIYGLLTMNVKLD